MVIRPPPPHPNVPQRDAAGGASVGNSPPRDTGLAHGSGAPRRAGPGQRRSDPTARQLNFGVAGSGPADNDTVLPDASKTTFVELFEKFITPVMLDRVVLATNGRGNQLKFLLGAAETDLANHQEGARAAALVERKPIMAA